jgi:hypothetical protein
MNKCLDKDSQPMYKAIGNKADNLKINSQAFHLHNRCSSLMSICLPSTLKFATLSIDLNDGGCVEREFPTGAPWLHFENVFVKVSSPNIGLFHPRKGHHVEKT